MESYLNEVLDMNDKDFVKVAKRRYGLDIDWYSDTYGRIIISGNIKYEAERNFRCGENFDKYKSEQNKNIKCLIVIICCLDKETYVKPLEEIKNFEEFMSNQAFEKPELFMIGKKIEGFVSKKDKKSRKQRFLRNKQFYIHTNEFMVVNNVTNVNYYVEDRITFDCIYHNIPTQKDLMLP